MKKYVDFCLFIDDRLNKTKNLYIFESLLGRFCTLESNKNKHIIIKTVAENANQREIMVRGG